MTLFHLYSIMIVLKSFEDLNFRGRQVDSKIKYIKNLYICGIPIPTIGLDKTFRCTRYNVLLCRCFEHHRPTVKCGVSPWNPACAFFQRKSVYCNNNGL